MISPTVKAVDDVVCHNIHPTWWVGDEVAWIAIGVAKGEAARDTNANTWALAQDKVKRIAVGGNPVMTTTPKSKQRSTPLHPTRSLTHLKQLGRWAQVEHHLKKPWYMVVSMAVYHQR